MSDDAAPPRDGGPTGSGSGFGLTTATFVIVSSMIGVGVLTTSGQTVLKLGSNQLMLALWVVGGAVALAGALTLAEVSASLPRSGGEYVIFREAYGPLPAFLAGWVSFQFGFSAPIAAAASAASSYLLAPFSLAEPLERLARPGLGTLAILVFATIHASGKGRSIRLQGIVTSLELAFLIAFAAAGLWVGGGSWSHLDDRPPMGPGSLAPLLFALVYISYGYTGWNAASYLAGEIRDAHRLLPRAIILGTSIVTLLYLALNLVYALALPATEILSLGANGNSEAVVPIAQLSASRLFGSWWADRLSVGVGLILLSNLSAYLLTGPRVSYAMARAGHFPEIVGRLSRRTGTPAIATGLQAGWGLVLLWSGTFNQIILYAGIGLSVASILSVAAVYVLRMRQPELPRPFLVPGYPWTPAFYVVVNLALTIAVFAEEPRIATYSMLSIISGLPVYLLMAHSRRRQNRAIDNGH
ncbi:APC family permease [Tundrisphaera lichenicola]|uniref:APC family permease n=1 Tax=Tundrisphaera lichenicola TaxID=2029860 RepID=UPI003EC138B3